MRFIHYTLYIIFFSYSISISAQPACVGEQGQLRWFYWNNIDPTWTINGLYDDIYYPQTPDGMQILNRPETPVQFNDRYGSSIRGYIMAPNTGTYKFNITGDDDGEFFLSNDDTPANKSRRAYFTYNTGSNHESQTSQTTTDTTLTAGQYYYFELNHVEGGGNDFITLHWETPDLPDTWQVVGTEFVYDYICESLCEPLGTLCDDGDPTTTNDQQDGFCNCFGEQEQTNECVGERASITALYFDNLNGDELVVLDTAVIYPNAPTEAQILDNFSRLRNRGGKYATRVRTFLSVPMTGDYIFNLTGDDETILYWTGSDDPNDPLQTLAHVSNYTNSTEHDKYPEQTSATVNLQKGEIYYLELLSKENGGGDHFGVWWQAPFYPDNDWRVIQGTYLYQYACESACLPVGTPCDDGNAGTYDDVADENCGCVGTPCGVPDCDDVPAYRAYEICGTSDKHSNQTVDSWLSCSPAPNPNSMRGMGHWIMYDFNDIYQLYDMQIWNYNVENETERGFREVAVDYSLDGVVWQNLGTQTWGEATGVKSYEGLTGLNFSGKTAQYVVFTALSNYGDDNCSGFSEISMTARPCQPAGTACDDFNAGTDNDQFNNNCECIGQSNGALAVDILALTAEWKGSNVLVEWTVENESNGTYYEIQRSLDARQFESIGLLRGSSKSGEKTKYQLVDNKGGNLANELYYRIKSMEVSGEESFSNTVSVERPGNSKRLRINDLYPNPFSEQITIAFSTPLATEVNLQIFDVRGQLVRSLLDTEIEKGEYQYSWDGKDSGGALVPDGVYYLQLTDGKQRIGRKLIKG
ncbi:MAG: PA14 domain-containing protein [Saprospiraceae bacterium]